MDDTQILNILSTLKGRQRTLPALQHMFPDVYNYLLHRYSDASGNETLRELHYRLKNNIETLPVCKICGSPVKYMKDKGRYGIYCSVQCKHKDGQAIRAKSRPTLLKRYGSETYWNRAKAQQTMLERYGTDVPLRIPGAIERQQLHYKQTSIERYGVENITKLPETIQKIKQTNLQRYGTANVMQCKQVKGKQQDTCIKRYGVSNPMQSAVIKEKVKATCLERYGVDNIIKADAIKEKALQTLKDNYGVVNPMYSDAIKERAQNTCIEKYGAANPMQNHEIAQKSYTNRYNQNNYVGTSKLERLLLTYIKDHIDSNVKTQYYSDPYPYYCDFYLPKFDLYVELQGLWTHGGHAFNPDNIHDIRQLDVWKTKAKTSKFYQSAINIWTVKDPEKRQVAQANNLHYLEIFSNNLDECIHIINSQLINYATN